MIQTKPDALPPALLLLTIEGRIARWSREAGALTGFSWGEMIGAPLNVMRAESQRHTREAGLWLATSEGSSTGTAPRRKRDGSLFESRLTLRAVRSADGSLQGFAAALEDIAHPATQVEESLDAFIAGLGPAAFDMPEIAPPVASPVVISPPVIEEKISPPAPPVETLVSPESLPLLGEISALKWQRADDARTLERETARRRQAEQRAVLAEELLAFYRAALAHDEATAALQLLRAQLRCDAVLLFQYAPRNVLKLDSADPLVLDESWAGDEAVLEAARARQVLRWDDLSRRLSGNLFASRPTRAFAAVPMIWKDKVLGVLCVASARPAQFDDEELKLLAEAARALTPLGLARWLG